MLTTHDLVTGYRGMGYGATGRRAKTVSSAIKLTARPGQTLCLLGPNGCGKTTLFRTLLGLIAPISGSIRFGETELSTMSRADIARHVAYVPQTHSPPFSFAAIDIVMMGRTARLGRFALPGKSEVAIAFNALEQLGITSLADHDYSLLSTGQRQLVLIARAIAQQTPLIVMDEPTASLDFGNQARVLTELKRITQEASHGVILSTHNPDHAFALQADVALMNANGRLESQGPANQVLTSEQLSAAYGLPISVEVTTSGQPVCRAHIQPG